MYVKSIEIQLRVIESQMRLKEVLEGLLWGEKGLKTQKLKLNKRVKLGEKR